jgi:ABC-2 type transport system permease protein
MLMEVKKHFRLIWTYFKFNLSASMEYRGSFLMQFFGMVLNNASFAVFWWVVFSRVQSVQGYTFEDVMFIWALASSSFGIANVIFGNINNITNTIINGSLDTYLLQPKDVYINLLCSRTSVSAWGDLAYGYIVIFLVYGFQPLQILGFTGFVILGGLLMGSIVATAETLTFFVGNSSSISRLVTAFLLTFTIYPESIFKGVARYIVYTLLPAGFIVFVPLRLMKLFSWQMLLVLLLVDAGYVLFAYWLFRIGLKRYESGNLITTKL